MKRLFPNQLLNLLASLWSGCYSYVKWHQAWSSTFRVDFGVAMFCYVSIRRPIRDLGLYVDDLANLCQYNRWMLIVLCDILLLAPSIRELQHLLQTCESELIYSSFIHHKGRSNNETNKQAEKKTKN